MKCGLQECGLQWSWVPGSSLYPLNTNRSLKGSNRRPFTLKETLFADDTTLVGNSTELKTGKESVERTMWLFEEKCHDGKEEKITFGSKEAWNTRMFGAALDGKRMWLPESKEDIKLVAKPANGSGGPRYQEEQEP